MLKILKMALIMMMMKKIVIILKRITKKGSYPLVLERFKISREAVIVLDRLAGIQIPIQLEGVANPLAIHVFRIKRTSITPVLSSVMGAIIATTVNVRGEIMDVTHAVR